MCTEFRASLIPSPFALIKVYSNPSPLFGHVVYTHTVQICKRGATIDALFYSVLNSLVALTPLLAIRSRRGAV